VLLPRDVEAAGGTHRENEVLQMAAVAWLNGGDHVLAII
jgi:hypothetical protein